MKAWPLPPVFRPDMFAQPYMQHAFVAGLVAAVLAGLVGFFVVVRGVSFAAHSLAQIGFAGGAGAILLGLDPLVGLIVFAVAGALGLGALGAREHDRDAVTALVLVAALGVGALFLAWSDSYAAAATALLFGSILGVSTTQVVDTVLIALLCLALLGFLYRPLLLASINVDAATARGVPVRLVSIGFLVVVGLAAAATTPTVGTLLIFSLIVAPAGAAVRLARRPATVLLLSVAIGVSATCLGIALAYDTGWPVGFFIAGLVSLVYLAARLVGPRRALYRLEGISGD